MIDFYIGSIVPPTQLLYRHDFIRQIWQTLQKEHVLLIGPRRTGKSSVMNHLREIPSPDWIVVHLNVQDLEYPAQLFHEVIEKFYQQHRGFLAQSLAKGWQLLQGLMENAAERVAEIETGKVKLVLRQNESDWNANWKEHCNELLTRIRTTGHNVLIILDELPDMLLNIKQRSPDEAVGFMAWFRKQRETPPPHEDNIRWLVGGSINLPGTMESLGRIDLLNNLCTMQLPILRPEEVCDFVGRMLRDRGIGFDPSVPSLVEQALGRPIPMFLQMATKELCRSVQGPPATTATPAHVKEVFKSLTTGIAAQQHLQHYYSRIHKYYPEPQASLAHCILRQLCNSSEQGLTKRSLKTTFQRELGSVSHIIDRDLLFSLLMQDLQHDFYIGEVDTNRYDFESGLMKAWWKQFYGGR